MTNNFKTNWIGKLLIAATFSMPICLFAQDKKTSEKKDATPVAASMKLNFAEVDSVKVINVSLAAGEKPLEGIEVKFYVKRSLSLLPLISNGKGVSTDEKGGASVKFPKDLPGDCNGTIVVIAKVEDDENYGSFETKDSVKWGTIISISAQEEEWEKRSMSGTGSRVPTFLIATAGVIIIVVWGILLYVIFSLVGIKKAGIIKKQ